jgi:hypothetical protein
MRVFAFAAVFGLPIAAALAEQPARFLESVVYPLASNSTCWSSVSLRTVMPVRFRVAAHNKSGALISFAGNDTVPPQLAAGASLTLRLEASDEESLEAWVQLREELREESLPVLAIKGTTECVSNDALLIQPAGVMFPARNPWISGNVSDFGVKTVWVLNTSDAPAAATACYSSGTYVQVPDGDDSPGQTREVCSETDDIFLPPFAMRTLPVQKEGSVYFSLRTRGNSLIVSVKDDTGNHSRKYSVDSTVKFGNAK